LNSKRNAENRQKPEAGSFEIHKKRYGGNGCNVQSKVKLLFNKNN
jgi:hypothetical protein